MILCFARRTGRVVKLLPLAVGFNGPFIIGAALTEAESDRRGNWIENAATVVCCSEKSLSWQCAHGSMNHGTHREDMESNA